MASAMQASSSSSSSPWCSLSGARRNALAGAARHGRRRRRRRRAGRGTVAAAAGGRRRALALTVAAPATMTMMMSRTAGGAAAAAPAMDAIEELASSARRAYNAKDLRGALRDLDSIIAETEQAGGAGREDEIAVWYERRAQVKLDLKQFNESIADFDTAERLHSYKSLGLLTNRGLAHEGLSDWPAADADYSEAIRLSSELGGELPYVLNSRAKYEASRRPTRVSHSLTHSLTR